MQFVIVGAGALGNEVAKALGLLGAGAAVIVDPDRVEASNLTRSVLFRSDEAAGREKAEALAGASSRLFPDTRFSFFNRAIGDVGFGDVAPADLIFSCVDSDLPRLEIAYLSRQLGVAVSDGGLGGRDASRGRVSWFPPGDAACYGCLLRERRRRELFSIWESDGLPCWGEEAEEAPRPSTPTMAAIVGSMQVELGLRGLERGAKTGAETVEIGLDGAARMDVIRLRRNLQCMFHEAPLLRVAEERSDETAGGLLARCGVDGALLLDWPICLAARCLDCSFEWRPRLRLGLLRSEGRCSGCGSRNLGGFESLRSIEAGSPWAEVPLRELGLPPNHWHAVMGKGSKDS